MSALRVFEAAARHLSFTKAAEELFVTPGAVSQQIKQLEDHLGVELFVREGRRVALSEAGRAGVGLLRQGFDHLAEGVRLMRQPIRKGRVTISAAPSFAAKWLMPRLFLFNELHPDIDVWVSADMNPVSFGEADIDLAIRYGPGGYMGLHEEKLLEEAVVLVCAPALMEVAPIRAADDVRHHTLLHDISATADPTCPDWPMWLKAQGVAGVDATRGQRFNQSALVIEAAAAGRGVALAKRVIAANDLAAGRLIAPISGAAPVGFAYHLVWPEARTLGPAQTIFADWLRAQALEAADGQALVDAGGEPPVFAAHAI